MRVLILGGTAEARALAQALTDRAVAVVSSLAGRVSTPRLPAGEVRIGGFGGIDGLAELISTDGITHVVDATHPYATTMSAHGVAAADRAGVPFVRYARPGWRSHALAGGWTWVSSYTEAQIAADRLGSRPFITTGRQTLTHYLGGWWDRRALVRVVEPLGEQAPAAWTVVLDRGPYEVDAEHSLMSRHGVNVLLTKDSGGSYTAAKLTAADRLGIPVVVVRRPDMPTGAREVSTLDDVLATLLH